MFSRVKWFLFALLLASILGLAGCRGATAVSPSGAPSQAPGSTSVAPSDAPAPTSTTEPTPTATPEPLAARVNGMGIPLAEYEAELLQVHEAHKTLGKTSTPEEQQQLALDNMIDTVLLAQGAAEEDYAVSAEDLQAEIAALAQQVGGEGALQDWAARRGYDENAFRGALARQMAAAWQRDHLAAAVPTAAEQVHARQILTIDADVAQRALQYVQIPGTNFAAYAFQYDLQTGGDLGWFPRGYLTQPAVEEAAFSLEPGQISPVIESEVGYHILQVIAKEPSRALSPDARRVLQHKAIEAWLAERRAGAQIEIMLP